MTGYAALTPWTTPLRFTSRALAQCLSSSSSRNPPTATPALLTMTSSRPWAATVSRTSSELDGIGVGDVDLGGSGRGAEPTSDGERPLPVEVGDHHVAAARHEFATMARPMPEPPPVTIETLGAKPSRVMVSRPG